jgi:hypothetical protein
MRIGDFAHFENSYQFKCAQDRTGTLSVPWVMSLSSHLLFQASWALKAIYIQRIAGILRDVIIP